MLAQRSASSKKLPKGLDAAWHAASGQIIRLRPRRAAALRRAQRIVQREKEFTHLSDRRLRDQAAELKITFRRGRETHADINAAFAVIREAAKRTLSLDPYREQVAAALVMWDGCIAEMATGEGKTLAATLPATLGGWRGRGCHVVTVNDYLAKRDATEMGVLYRWLGLTVASVENETPPPLRRQAYAADITYDTNKEIAADYLRDRLALGALRRLPSALLHAMTEDTPPPGQRLVMRGLEFAIIDEVDSVMIDESVTPLIISGDAPNTQQVDAFTTAAEIASQLDRSAYKVDYRYREVRLTPVGQKQVEKLAESQGGLWANARRREELVTQALTAREMFLRDKQYVVQEDKIVIVDEATGRLMPDRTWRDGLHQAIEAKERVEVNPPKATYARVSFQRFFRLYKKLCGMTGTAVEAANELWQIYKLPMAVIPTHRPCIRVHQTDRIFESTDEKWHAIVEEIKTVHATGRPILVGTRSVQASEYLSERLQAEQLDHVVLNAVHHEQEAQIVAGAGQKGRITVATNMAGRGTDIKLGKGVAEWGGLHVLATERHESGRIDRQLFGRAARQGDPGSAIAFIAMEDELVQRYGPRASKWMNGVGLKSSRSLINRSQKLAQRIAFRQRQGVLKTDDWLDESLGFAGRET